VTAKRKQSAIIIEPPKPRGRPSTFSDKLADIICDRLAEGESLRSICAEKDFPSTTTVKRWLRGKPNFCAQYALAREDQADAIFDEIVDIADKAGRSEDLTVDMARVRIDARKWVAGKLAPKKYGDKTTVESTSTVKVEHTRRLDISTLSDDQLDALEEALRVTISQLDAPGKTIEHEE